MKNASIVALATSAKENSATSFVRFMPDGGKRAKIVVLSLAEKFATTPGEFTFGSMKAGKFIPFGETYRNEAPAAEVVKAKKAAKVSRAAPNAPATKKPAAKAKKAEATPFAAPTPKGDAGKLFEGKRRGTGYVAKIDELLYQTSGKKEQGFLRSVHTVTDAVRLVLKAFPEANPGSVRRVVKVRPRHLERSKTSGVTGKAPRWALMGIAGVSEYMKEMDAALMKGTDKKELADHLSKKFGRDLTKVLHTIQARTPKLRAKHGKDAVGTKPARALKGEKTKAQATREKNEALIKGKVTPGAEIVAGTPISAPAAPAESPV